MLCAVAAVGLARVEYAAASGSVVMEGIMRGPDPGGSGRTSTRRVRLYYRYGAMRIEHDAAGGRRDVLISPAGDSVWLVDEEEGIAMPVQATVLRDLAVNPEDPCAGMGMSARCEPVQSRSIAGVVAKGWRYRNARGRGPAGTNRGELWLDPATGLVLSYRGQAASRRERRDFHAVSVYYQELPEALFQLPETEAIPGELSGKLPETSDKSTAREPESR